MGNEAFAFKFDLKMISPIPIRLSLMRYIIFMAKRIDQNSTAGGLGLPGIDCVVLCHRDYHVLNRSVWYALWYARLRM